MQPVKTSVIDDFLFVSRYLALESLCSMANSEFSADAVRKHQEIVIQALKVCLVAVSIWPFIERGKNARPTC